MRTAKVKREYKVKRLTKCWISSNKPSISPHYGWSARSNFVFDGKQFIVPYYLIASNVWVHVDGDWQNLTNYM